MSIQFGRWNFDGQPPAPDYIEKVSTALAPYGPDSNESYCKDGVSILYRAFHTTKESHREKQPCISTSGAVITWDGRLDNRTDLIRELRDSLHFNSTDVTIVAAAYEKWGADCLSKLIGDWALSIWNPRDRSVLLAKDPIGTKHLYYSFDNNQLTWSTILDPLVLFAGRTFEICEAYIAGWFAYFPAADLTPYVGIHSVPPSSSVLLQPEQHTINRYWDFDAGKKIRYHTDAEYEEHFRSALAKATQRRLRSDRPVLAELSGGMDSSSIVCMADIVIAHGQAECSCLDTISWFDNSYDHLELDMNELPYLIKVEEKRGRTGCHIDLSALKQKEVVPEKPFESEFESNHFAATPNSKACLHERFKEYAAYMRSQGHRVVLSGIGGGEVTGDGVPTPRQELQNFLVRARFVRLVRQLSVWAAKMRRPRFLLLWEAMQEFIYAHADVPKDLRPAPWLDANFVSRNHVPSCGYPFRVKIFGPLPSFQDQIHVLDSDRRLLATWTHHPELPRDVRFPYFDRDLLEFMYAIPREQIVRAGQRRSLMKRSLKGIVPDELLNRRRKAFVLHEPKEQMARKETSHEWPTLAGTGQPILSSSLGIIDPILLSEALQKARRNEEIPSESLKRSLTLEWWLRHLAALELLARPMSTQRERYSSSPETEELQAQLSRRI